MVKKILILITALMVILPLASAFNLDPFAVVKEKVKDNKNLEPFLKEDFNEKYGVITLYKTFMWLKNDNIAEYSLTKNTEQCLIDCEAEGKAVLYRDMALFDDMKFYNKIGSLRDLDYKIYILGTEEYVEETPIYETMCEDVTDLKNGTINKVCQNVQTDVRKETKTREVWKEYNNEVLPAGNYTWKLEGKKNPAESIDFIPVASSEELSDWAWWNSGWTKKKAINLDSNVSGTGIILTFNKSSNMNADCSDLRFVNASENAEFSYNIMVCNSTTVQSYVYIPYQTDRLYLYYGNTGATTTSDNSLLDKMQISLGSDTTDLNINNIGGNYPVGFRFNWTTNYIIKKVQVYVSEVAGSGAGNTVLGLYRANSSNDGITGSLIGTNSSTNNLIALGYYNFTWGGNETKVTTGGSVYIMVFFSTYTSTTNYVRLGESSGTWPRWMAARTYGDVNTICLYPDPSSSNINLKIFGGNFTQVTPTFGAEQSANGLSVTLNSPANYYNSTSSSITFNCSATDDTAVLNLTLIIDGKDNYTITNTSANQNLSLQVTRTLSVGNHNWTCRASDGTGDIEDPYTAPTFYFSVDTIPPTIRIENITNISTISLPVTTRHMINASDANLNKCWYYTSDNFTNTTVTCNSSFNINWNSSGIKTIYAYANDTFGNINSTSGSFYINYLIITQNGSATAGEGTAQTFTLLINSTDFPTGNANANLWYNGKNYGYDTKTAISPNIYYFTKEIVIPSGTGSYSGNNVNWYWVWNATNSATYNTTTQTQKVYIVNLNDCSLVGGKVILNMSLKDEETKTLVNVTYPNLANIEADILVTSLKNSSQTWNFHKQWINNNSVAVCVPYGLLNYSTYRIDFVAGYSATGKVNEFYYLDNGTLDNSGMFNPYTNSSISLYDLNIADSTSFLFEFTNENHLSVENAIVHTFRKYIGEGAFYEVERSKQDNNGQTIVHLVEEDVIYYFTISQNGRILYTSSPYTAKCLSTPCKITLSASPTETNWSILDNEGGKYVIRSNKDNRIVSLNFNLDSPALVNLSVFSYNGRDVNYVNGSSLKSMAGSIDVYVPLSYGNKTFFAVIYKNNEFIKSVWIDFVERAKDYFGTTGALLGGFMVLAILLMAVSEGAGFILFAILGLIIISIMKLVDLDWLALSSIIGAGGVIVYKLVSRRGR